MAEAIDQLGRRREALELERACPHAKGMSDAHVHEGKNARHRALRTATEAQRLEELGERDLVFGSTLYHDDIGFRVAQGLRGLDE